MSPEKFGNSFVECSSNEVVSWYPQDDTGVHVFIEECWGSEVLLPSPWRGHLVPNINVLMLVFVTQLPACPVAGWILIFYLVLLGKEATPCSPHLGGVKLGFISLRTKFLQNDL